MDELTFEQLPRAVGKLYDKLDIIEKLLLANSDYSQQKNDPLLTIKQAADFLSLSVPTIYGLVQRATIPVSKRGKRLYFSQQELTDWIKAGRKLTTSEIYGQASSFLATQKKRG